MNSIDVTTPIKVTPFDPGKADVWKTKIDPKDRLVIVNPADFKPDTLLSKIGLNGNILGPSFGIADEVEIKSRLALMEFFLQQEDLDDYATDLKSFINLPSNKDNFYRFYNPASRHNEYWRKLHHLFAKIDDQAPSALQKLKKVFSAYLDYEEKERTFSRYITDRMENMGQFEGFAHIVFDGDSSITGSGRYEVEVFVDGELVYESEFRSLEDAGHRYHSIKVVGYDSHRGYSASLDFGSANSMVVHGYTVHSYNVLNICPKPYPRWVMQKWNPWAWLFGRKERQKIDALNKENIKKAYQPTVISRLSLKAVADIMKGFLEHMGSISVSAYNNYDVKLSYNLFRGGYSNLYFHYGEDGLAMKILELNCSAETDTLRLKFQNYPGFSGADESMFRSTASSLRNNMQIHALALENNDMITKIIKEKEDFFNFFSVQAPNIDARYKWFALENIWLSPAYKEFYDNLLDHRTFFHKQVASISAIVDIVSKYKTLAEKTGEPICIPSITQSHNIVSFRSVFPFRLIGEEKDIQPIRNLPPLNGQIVALTGRHGGGKSTTGITIMDYIYLVMSGLPVLGDGFTTNIKKVIGLVVNEEGKGSTAQVLIRKINNLVKGIGKVSAKEAVVFIDEMGKGTQEVDGFETSMKVLQALKDRGVSVIFNTQILALAQNVVTELNGLAMKVDDRHAYSIGIGDGGMKDLVRSVGLDKSLARLKKMKK
ncbi:MAG: hypothetical protein NUV82_04630 [Candidatus Komeilibacteria bacterium]|nr:hypothetical protein [Candidatus Komeilibacteria bacterium]